MHTNGKDIIEQASDEQNLWWWARDQTTDLVRDLNTIKPTVGTMTRVFSLLCWSGFEREKELVGKREEGEREKGKKGSNKIGKGGKDQRRQIRRAEIESQVVRNR